MDARLLTVYVLENDTGSQRAYVLSTASVDEVQRQDPSLRLKRTLEVDETIWEAFEERWNSRIH